MAPTPPLGKLVLVIAVGSNDPQLFCALPITPGLVTLQHCFNKSAEAVETHPLASVTVTLYVISVVPEACWT